MLVRRASGLPVLALLLTGALVSAGSSREQDAGWSFITEESDDPMLPGVNPLEVPGNIVTAGSSTVFPLSERMVERFKYEGFPGAAFGCGVRRRRPAYATIWPPSPPSFATT